jgi:hypothetical protein
MCSTCLWVNWPNEDFIGLGPFLALAIAFVWAAYAWLRMTPTTIPAPAQVRWRLVAPILGLSTLLPLLVTGLLIQHWSPYYTCMAALGFAPIAGIWLARARLEIACLAITAYVSLGVWSRTAVISPDVTTERNLRVTGVALSSVERGFKRLHSSFPADSYIYVSDQATGVLGLYNHLYRFQPLRVWYKEPSLFVLDPNRHRAGGRQDFLFWLIPD